MTSSSTPLPTPTVRRRVEADEQAWSPDAVHILGKPTGAICNLGCSYCFFLDKEALYEGDRFRMSDELAETYIRSLVEAHRVPQVTVAWQGGEPTLMGLGFYRKTIELEERYRQPGMSFLNTLQTNGTLLTDEWCEFFAEHGFLIGISIDGPQPLHDAYRVNKRGEGTFDKVMRGLRLLQKHSVELNVLTTVNRLNGDHPLDVYRFLRDEVETDWMQFIPVVERVDELGNPADLRGAFASERSVGPEQFGTFLTTIFDEWVRHDVAEVFVQTIEAAARNWAGMGQSGMCVFNETCGLGLALEHNGDLYSCDHFVDPEFLVGNVVDTPITELVSGRRQYEFGQEFGVHKKVVARVQIPVVLSAQPSPQVSLNARIPDCPHPGPVSCRRLDGLHEHLGHVVADPIPSKIMVRKVPNCSGPPTVPTRRRRGDLPDCRVRRLARRRG